MMSGSSGMGPGMMGPSGAMSGRGLGARGGSGLKPPSTGGDKSGSTADGSGNKSDKDADKDKESEEPQYLTVPRYNFGVQFVWKETLLSARLEKQASDWETEKQKAGTSNGGTDLASSSKGGA
jgi:hypothetical protein